MRQNELSELSRSLDWFPPAFHGNRLNLLFLSDAHLISDPRGFLRCLDVPGLVNEDRELCVNPEITWPFPEFHLEQRPAAIDVQEYMAEGTDHAAQYLPVQRDVTRMIMARAEAQRPDVVLLMVADGLSYYDLEETTAAEPYVVDGVTITAHGYRQVIGNPPLSVRLFGAGFHEQRGYTFFDPEENGLAGQLFSPFGFSQVMRIRSFDECLMDLRSRSVGHAYVQVTIPGLDGLCHAHTDTPPVEHYRDELLRKFASMVDCLGHGQKRVLACLTSDHGILWRDKFDPSTWRVVSDLPPDHSGSGRYVPGAIMRSYTLVKPSIDQTFSLLKFPYIARQWRSNEWGMHGGVSAWESIVPVITEFAM